MPYAELQRQPMYPETDPLTAFTKIFGGVLPTHPCARR